MNNETIIESSLVQINNLKKKTLIDIIIFAINNHIPFIFLSLYNLKFSSNEILQIKYYKKHLICSTNYLNILGIQGLIGDINEQLKIFENYDKRLLTIISDIIINRLISFRFEWLCVHQIFYYQQIKKKYHKLKIYKYWDIFNNNQNNFINKNKIIIWQPTNLQLKIGESISQGVIGNKKIVLKEEVNHRIIQHDLSAYMQNNTFPTHQIHKFTLNEKLKKFKTLLKETIIIGKQIQF